MLQVCAHYWSHGNRNRTALPKLKYYTARVGWLAQFWQLVFLTESYLYCSKVEMHIFWLFYFSHQMLHGTVLQHDPMQLITYHSSSPTTASKRLKPTQTHLEWVGKTCSRRTECPCKYVQVVSSNQAEVDDHPSSRDLQPVPVHTWEMLSSYWFSTRTCMSLNHKIPMIELLLYEKSVRHINSDLNHLQNEIW